MYSNTSAVDENSGADCWMPILAMSKPWPRSKILVAASIYLAVDVCSMRTVICALWELPLCESCRWMRALWELSIHALWELPIGALWGLSIRALWKLLYDDELLMCKLSMCALQELSTKKLCSMRAVDVWACKATVWETDLMVAGDEVMWSQHDQVGGPWGESNK